MRLHNQIITTISTFALLACQFNAPQTTTGRDFAQGQQMDRSTQKAAGVKPILKFPAKFCLVKVVQGQMAQPASAEFQAWVDMGFRHPEWGHFDAVNPLAVDVIRSERLGSGRGRTNMGDIRAAAARQHCHAILSYRTVVDGSTYTAQALLFDTRNGYTYLSGSASGANNVEAVRNLAAEFEQGMEKLYLALR